MEAGPGKVDSGTEFGTAEAKGSASFGERREQEVAFVGVGDMPPDMVVTGFLCETRKWVSPLIKQENPTQDTG